MLFVYCCPCEKAQQNLISAGVGTAQNTNDQQLSLRSLPAINTGVDTRNEEREDIEIVKDVYNDGDANTAEMEATAPYNVRESITSSEELSSNAILDESSEEDESDEMSEVDDEQEMDSVLDDDIYNRDWNITPRSAMDALKVSGKDKGAIGIKKIRKKRLEDISDKHRKLVVCAFKNMVAKLATAILPTDPKTLVSEAMNLLDTKTRDKSAIEKCLAACNRGTKEKRLLRSVAVGCYTTHEAKRMIAKDVRSFPERVRVPTSRPLSVKRLTESKADRLNRVTQVKERYKTGNVRRSIERAKNDWNYFEEHGHLPDLRRVVERVSNPTINECVRFIYCPRNRDIMASGSKKVMLSDGKSIVLPQVKRRTSRNELYEDYCRMKRESTSSASIPLLKKSSFFNVIGRLTSGQAQMTKCVDYCLGVLIHENVKKLERVVNVCVKDVLKREQLQKEINAVTDYLKHDYVCELKEFGDPVSSTRRALVGYNDGTENVERDISRSDNCLKAFQVIENVRCAVEELTEPLSEVLNDCGNKFKLFMAHKLRCHVQQSVYGETEKWLDEQPAETAAIVTIDFKQKFIPKKYREKQTDYFGKKGMSWHGSTMTIRSAITGSVNERQRRSNSLNNETSTNRKHIHFDHICRNDTDQKAATVASILELVARKTVIELPNVKKIIIRSDNARNYNNKLIPVIAPFIFLHYGIRLERFVHSETQDGKGPSDVHFATALRYVDKYIESLKRDVVTPKDLCDAINHGYGLRGTVAELYDVDLKSPKLKVWIEGMKQGGSLAQIGRVNDIVYVYSDNNMDSVTAYTKEYKYSNEVYWSFQVGQSKCLDNSYVAHDSGTEVVLSQEVVDNEETEDNRYDSEGELEEQSEILSHPNLKYFSVLQLGEEGPSFGPQNVTDDQCEAPMRALMRAAVKFTGSITGVKLLESSGISRDANVLTRTVANTTSPFDDEDEDEPLVTSDENDKPVKNVGACVVCCKCGQSFRSMTDAEKHLNVCKVSKESKTVVDRACRIAEDLIKSNSVTIYSKASDNPDLQAISVSEDVRKQWLFPPQWAVRTSDGAALGRNFVGPFKEQIRQLVVRGHYDKGKKLSGPQMLEQLEAYYPNRMDLPSVYHIKNHVQTVLLSIRKAEKALKMGLTEVPSKRNKCVPDEYAKVIEEIVREEPTIRPLQVVSKLMTRMGIDPNQKPQNFPERKKIAQKVSTVKTKLKKST